MSSWKSVSLKKYLIEKTIRNSSNQKLEVFSLTNEDGLVKSDDFFKKQVYSEELSKYKIIEPNEIGYNPSRINVGSIAICEKEKGLLSPLYVIIRCKGKLNPQFLFNFLKSKEGINRVKHYSQKGVRHSLNFENLTRMEIELPSPETQNEIVSLCNFMKEIKNKRKHSIQIADEIILATFIDMFGDPSENPMKLEFVDLKTKLLEEPQNGLYVHESLYGSGTPIARIDSFYGGVLDNFENLKKVAIEENDLETYRLVEDDIILSRTNSLIYLGKCALLEKISENVVFESNMMRIKVNKKLLLPQFLIVYFLTNLARVHIMRRAKKAANQVSVNQEDIMSMKIPDIPITQQKNFAKVVQKWFTLKKNLKTNLSLLDELISSTTLDLFQGKIKLSTRIS